MFKGTLPSKGVMIVSNIVKDWNCKRIFVGCSGNFTIERTISSVINCPITSNDVTIYSSYIGRFLAGEALDDLQIRDDYEGSCQYFREYMNSDVEKIATLILASDVCEYDGDEHPYTVRMREAYRKQWPVLHAKMVKKIENVKTKIDSFYFGDVMEMLDGLDDESGFVSFPPFFKGGYEKMWHNIEKVFTFTPPTYEVFDPEKHIEQFCHKVLKAKNFVIITERKVPELEQYYFGTMQTAKGKAMYFYSKTTKKVFVKQKVEYSNLFVERIREDDDITDVSIKPISTQMFNELRARYLSKRVNPVGGGYAYGLFNQDNRLFGVMCFTTGMMFSGFDNLIDGPSVYLLTDFAVSPTKIKRLSKLVLYCSLSKEAQMLAERCINKKCRSVVTNVFSKGPMSMKYRGLYNELNKKVVEKDEQGNPLKYDITYGAKAGQWTLREGFEIWKQKSKQ